MTVEGYLFGVVTAGIVMMLRVRIMYGIEFFDRRGDLCIIAPPNISSHTMYIFVYFSQVVNELWHLVGGAYNVDTVLNVMVSGLEKEMQARMESKMINSMQGSFLSPPSNIQDPVIDAKFLKKANNSITRSNSNIPRIKQQGANMSIPFQKVGGWVRNSRS